MLGLMVRHRRRCGTGALILVGALATIALAPSSPAHAGYMNGEDYLVLDESERNVYVTGLWDMMEHLFESIRHIVDDDSIRHIDRLMQCTENMSSHQLRELFDAYNDDHPEDMFFDVASTFEAALKERCP